MKRRAQNKTMKGRIDSMMKTTMKVKMKSNELRGKD